MKKILKSSINYGDNVLVIKTFAGGSFITTGIISGYNKGFIVQLPSGRTIIENSDIKFLKLKEKDVSR